MSAGNEITVFATHTKRHKGFESLARGAITAACASAMVVAAMLGSPAYARADIIITNTGGRLVGEIIREDDYHIHIRTAAGVTVIERDEVESIERGQSPAKMFEMRLKSTPAKNVEKNLQLAEWCQERGLEAERQLCLERVIAAAPDHVVARLALGYQEVAGRWLRGDELKVARGFVKHDGKWIRHEDKARLSQGLVEIDGQWISKEAAERARLRREMGLPLRPSSSRSAAGDGQTPESAARKVIHLPEADNALLMAARSRSQEKRVAALEEIKRRGAPLTDALSAKIDKEVAQQLKKLHGYFKNNRGQLRLSLAQLIKERRKTALTFIRDPSKYPDENHGAVAQPEVDRLVGEVRRPYENPFQEICQQSDTVKGMLTELDRLLSEREQYVSGPPASEETKRIKEELAGEVTESLSVKLFGADEAERKRIETSLGVLAYNLAVKTTLNDEERACILATNEYRMLMGLKALKAFEPLVQAARKHSEEMKRLGYFSHNSPVPANASPGKRCANEGASYTGENIAMGQRSGRPTFRQWYNSSGHHRNILGNHNSIGIGQSGHYWTQNFGTDNPK